MSPPFPNVGYLLYGATLHTAGDQGVIESGAVYLEDQSIRWLGKYIDWSESMMGMGRELNSIDCTGEHICPGFIDAHCYVGFESKDIQESSEHCSELTPQLKASDSISLRAKLFSQAYQAGVTTVCVLPSSPKLITGSGVVLKTFGENLEAICLRDPACLSVNFAYRFNHNSNKQESDYFALMKISDELRSTFESALIYEENRLINPDKTPIDRGQETLLAVLKRELPVHAHASTAEEITLALRLAREFGYSLVISYAYEVHKVLKLFEEVQAAIVYGPNLKISSIGMDQALLNRSTRALNRAGIKFAQMSGYPQIALEYFSLQAGLHIRDGLDEHEALKSITAYPAEVLGLANQIGQLKIGLDADLLRLSGPPLEIKTRVIETWLNGSVMVKGVSS